VQWQWLRDNNGVFEELEGGGGWNEWFATKVDDEAIV